MATAMKDFAPYMYRPGHGGGDASSGGGRGGGGGGDHGGGGGGSSPVQFSPDNPVEVYRGKLAADWEDKNRTADWVRRQIAPNQPAPDQSQSQQPSAWDYGPGSDASSGVTDDQGNPVSVETQQQTQAPADFTRSGGPPPQQPPPVQPLDQSQQGQLARYNNAMTRTRMQMMTGQINEATGNELIARIMTGKGPLDIQQQAAQVHAQQLQNQEMMHANALQATMQDMTEQQRAAVMDRFTHTYQDGTRVLQLPGQRPIVLPPRNQAAQENAHQQRTLDTAEDNQFMTHLEHAREHVFGKGTGTGLQTSDLQTRSFTRPDGTQETRQETREEALARIMTRDHGASSLSEVRQNREDRRATDGIRRNVEAQMSREESGPNRPAWAASPETRHDEAWERTQAKMREAHIRGAARAPQPIAESTPLAEVPQGQRTILTRLADFRRRLDEDGMTGTTLNRAISLFRRYGSTEAMPDRLKTEFERNWSLWNQAYGPQVSRPAEAPAQPPTNQNQQNEWLGAQAMPM